MGFDNECILNIQSLPGEYFCPVCRTLVYPSEALQTQCTHLYCKPCLAYIVATTCACPYDGYLVSEADAKPLTESNKPTAEAIEKIQVHCLYHRSGCQWQGTLSECITHCTSCNFGNSPVVCNRCGTQIVHRQVQEHAQICPGVQPQAQQSDSSQTQVAATAAQTQNVAQPTVSASQESAPQPAASTTVVAASSVPAAVSASTPATAAAVPAIAGQDQGQPGAAAQPQVAAQAPTTEQWYQQQQLQYQQYYQQYPGYDPYQQQYQQYGYYQQQAPAHYPQAYVQPHPVQVQQQPQVYAQQPQAQPQTHAQPPPQTQVQTHGYAQAVPLAQPPQAQATTNLQQPQMHPSTQVPVQQPQAHQIHPQPPPQAQPSHLPQLRPQHQPVIGQHPTPQVQQQQPHVQYQQQPNLQSHAQPVQQPPMHMHPPAHPRPHSLAQPQPQPQPQHPIQTQPQPQPQPLSQAQLPPHPQGQPQQPQSQVHPGTAHAVSGHQSFPQTHLQQQTPLTATPQRPMHMHPPMQGVSHQQFPYPAQMQNQYQNQPPSQPQMRPHPSQVPAQGQQHAVIHPTQGPHMHVLPGQQQAHHLVHPTSQQIHHTPGMQVPSQHPSIPQQQPQGPPHHNQLHHQASYPPQQPVHPQQGLRPQGPPFVQQHTQLQPLSQSAPRPAASAHPLPQQTFAQTSGGPGIRPQGSSDQNVASLQVVQTVNQSAPLPSSPAVLHPSADEKQESSISEKVVHAAVEVPSERKGDALGDLKEKPENDSEENLSEKPEENVADGEHPGFLVNNGASEAKPSAKGEGISEVSPNKTLVDSSVARSDGEGAIAVEAKEAERKSDGSDDKSAPGHTQVGVQDAIAKPLGMVEKATQSFALQGPAFGNERGNMQGPPRQQGPMGAPPYDGNAPHDRTFQPGYADRSMAQFPPHGMAPGDPRSFPPPHMQPNLGVPPHMHDQERHPQQALPHAPPYMPDAMSQRPPAPDRLLPAHMSHLQEPPPRAMLMNQGQPLVPNQMRPSLNFPDNLVHQGQQPIVPDPLQAKHPPGNFAAPGPSGPLGHGPTFGPPQGPQLAGQGQMVISHAGAVGTRIPHAEPFAGPAAMNARLPPMHLEGQLRRPHPSNPLESGQYDGRQPEFHRPMPTEHFPHGVQGGNPPNMSTMNGFPGKVADPSLSQGPIGDRFKPLPDDRYKPLPDDGLRPMADERFRPYGADPGRRIIDRRDFEEDLKQFPRPRELDTEASSKFENYLSSSRSQLERSSLGLDGAPRPFDRGFGSEGLSRIGGTSPVPSRLTPGSHLPVGSGGSLHPMDVMERSRTFGMHDDNMGRKGDLPLDFHRPPSEFGHHRIDNLHSLRSPGRELSGLPSSRFGGFSRFEEFNREPHSFSERAKQHNPSPDSIGLHDKMLHGSGMLPSHLRRGENDGLRMSDLPAHMRGGNLDGRDVLPSHMRGDDPLAPGNFRSHLRLGELSGLENVPPHLRSRDFARIGDPFPMHGFPSDTGGFNSGSFQGVMDPLDHPRKRKPMSIGWCRICKIDCETAEGLDLHSQTKEHQKITMDIVLSIKQDNAKKHKLSSEEHEESNKSRKTGLEGRPSRR